MSCVSSTRRIRSHRRRTRVSPTDLNELVRQGPHAADELPKMLKAARHRRGGSRAHRAAGAARHGARLRLVPPQGAMRPRSRRRHLPPSTTRDIASTPPRSTLWASSQQIGPPRLRTLTCTREQFDTSRARALGWRTFLWSASHCQRGSCSVPTASSAEAPSLPKPGASDCQRSTRRNGRPHAGPISSRRKQAIDHGWR